MAIKIDKLSDEIMKGLIEYKDLVADDVKSIVKKVGNDTKNEIKNNAPKRTGAYKKSWSVKITKENSNALTVTVHSKNRYRLTHLLEKGHAKRGGGRTKAIPHIGPAEEKAIKELYDEISRKIGGA